MSGKFVEIRGDTVTSITGGGTPKLFQGADWFNLEYQGVYYETAINPNVRWRGNSSIHIALPVGDPDDLDPADRSEISVSHQDNPYEYHLGQTRYFGFAMFLPTTNVVPQESNIIFAQLFQGNAGHHGGVPVTATLLQPDPTHLVAYPEDILFWQVAARSDDGSTSVVAPVPMQLGVWHQFLFKYYSNNLDMAGLGHCAVWMDRSFIGTVHHNIGSNFIEDDPFPVSDDQWMIRCGAYRTENSDAARHDAYFDEIRLSG